MKLTRYENFFPEDLYSELVSTAKSLLKRNSHTFMTNTWWDEKIVKDSFPVLIHPLFKNSELFAEVREQIEKRLIWLL